ncbi:MAG: hypothetical protein CBC28_00850 [Flavobacteriaceae bacterium TMED68]|nr:MAG: hypothetical protein CBC28_00850 [Flavobacteriaceae bacterium TMED68]|tara:strand:+ start:14813 stop:15331 length:519 start_codon:yes stop_codon:yes gene_type:complete
MKQNLYFILLVIFCSCSENKVRYPLNKGKKTFLSNSATRNKILMAREELMIRKSANYDSLFTFYNSQKGFLYAYVKKVSENEPLPQKGTRLRFTYKIEDLNKKILYTKNELGIVDYLVDKENILPALREGVKIMRPKEIVVFLFPSYLCFGYQGDGNKVGVSQPLRYTIERL